MEENPRPTPANGLRHFFRAIHSYFRDDLRIDFGYLIVFVIVSFGGCSLRLLHWTAAPAWMLEFVLPMLMLYIYFQLREIQDERAERLRVREEARRPREED